MWQVGWTVCAHVCKYTSLMLCLHTCGLECTLLSDQTQADRGHCCVCCTGACPKSYGTNVARLAGLPASVVTRAGVMSSSREAMYAAGAAQQQQDRQQQPQASPAVGGADAMDVDVCQGPSGGDAELQQLLGNVRKCLLKLKAGEGAGEGQQQVQEQLAQLQQLAALLCA